MSRYISIFFLCIFISVILFFVLGNLFDGGDYVETAVYTFGTILIILLSFLISLLVYLINFVKKHGK
ncbi:hypothetical protein C1N55_00825 [Lysinibacillus sp. SGAir0095]|nr:hypothetical protein C1N55_00825 [Lysinibacillus sp. SGAir0095]